MTIEVRNVRVQRGSRTVLEVPELVLGPERVIAVLGPNGAGKSTLLRVIAGLESASAGEVRIAGAARMPGWRPTVSLAFQQAVFVQGTVRQNIELALRLRGAARAERAARIASAAGLLGVSHLLDRDARRLSGGESQRANLARALAVPGDVVLLDEPLAGMDEPTRGEVLALLPQALQATDAPVIMVTHNRDEALRLAERAVVISDGQVVANGPLPDLFRAPPSAKTAALLGFTLLAGRDGEVVAVAPGGLIQGGGDLSFRMRVRSTHELPYHAEATGEIGGATLPVRVSLRVKPGDEIDVVPEPGKFVSYPADEPGS